MEIDNIKEELKGIITFLNEVEEKSTSEETKIVLEKCKVLISMVEHQDGELQYLEKRLENAFFDDIQYHPIPKRTFKL